jgi:hypothetical protein
MVGFTAFSEQSGEEAAYVLMRSLSKLMGEGVRQQGGIVQGLYRRRHHGGVWCADILRTTADVSGSSHDLATSEANGTRS